MSLPLIKLEESPSIASLLSDVITDERLMTLVKSFYYSIENVMLLFLLYSIKEENYIDYFSNMKPHLFIYLYNAGFDLLTFC